MLSQSQIDQITFLLETNPLFSDSYLSQKVKPPVSRDTIRRYRIKLGCQTNKRISIVNGNIRAYTIESDDDIGDVSLEMLQQLAALPQTPLGREGLKLIKDILEVIDEQTRKENA